MTNEEKLRELYKANGLTKDDVFIMERGGKKIPIITRLGIEKIQANNGIVVHYEVVNFSQDYKYVVIKGLGEMASQIGTTKIESYGEVNPENCTQKYPFAMAEKRALSRVVLKLAGFYALGAFGEDEFKDTNN